MPFVHKYVFQVWYTVTVEIVLQRVDSFCAAVLCVPNFCLRASLASYLLFRAACRDKACFEFSNVLLKHSFWRVCPKKPESFSLDKTFFINARWVSCWSVCTEMFQYKASYMEDSFFLEWFFLCRGSERGYCVIRDYVLLIFVKGENTKLKSANCEWFACRDT